MVAITILQEGIHTFEVRAIDGAGNVQPAPYDTVTTVVDTEPPVLALVSQPGRYIRVDNATVCVTVDDTTATVDQVTATLDGVAVTVAGGCVRALSLHDGSHTLSMDCMDLAGNPGTAVTATFTVDTVSPSHTLTLRSPSCVTAATSSGNMTVCSSATSALFDVLCVAPTAVVVETSPCGTWADVDSVPITGSCSAQTASSVFNASALTMVTGGVLDPTSTVEAALAQAQQVSLQMTLVQQR